MFASFGYYLDYIENFMWKSKPSVHLKFSNYLFIKQFLKVYYKHIIALLLILLLLLLLLFDKANNLRKFMAKIHKGG